MSSISNYPVSYDDITTRRDGVDFVMADHYNYLASAIMKIEKALGLSPQGTYATVRARFEGLDSLYIKNQNAAVQSANFWVLSGRLGNLRVKPTSNVDGAVFDPYNDAGATINSAVFRNRSEVIVSKFDRDGQLQTSAPIISSATGAPLQVSSKELVANLNSEMVSGRVLKFGTFTFTQTGSYSGEQAVVFSGAFDTVCEMVLVNLAGKVASQLSIAHAKNITQNGFTMYVDTGDPAILIINSAPVYYIAVGT